jgi:hypothetical protein
MYLIPIAWIYVVFMMAVAEATNSNGTVLGAIITFILYGVLPVGLILYFMGTPARRRARQLQEAAWREEAMPASELKDQPDARSHATTDTVSAVRKED